MIALVLTALLVACNPDVDDSGLMDPLPVGEVFELESTSDGVSGDFNTPGTYIVVLFSADDAQGTFHHYGASAAQASWTAAPEPPPPARLPSGVVQHQPPDDYTREFSVYNGWSYQTIVAEADFVTDELVIWRDLTTENPLGDIDETTLDEVIEKFEGIVLPRTRQIFGQESDVDGSERIDVLLTYTVNQYGAVAYVSWCDIADLPGCGGHSNGGETIYMGIPDPESSYSSANAIVEIWAHELNHLVYAWNKYVGNGMLSASENIYLTEGMSELAQDLTGFNNGNQYIWAAAIDMADYYGDEDYSIQGVSINDFLRGDGYYDAWRDGPLRGGSYLFLRYLFEQAGGMLVGDDGVLTDAGGMDWLHRWFASPELGTDCVLDTTGREVEDLALDWYTALVVTGKELNDVPAYNYQERVQDPLTSFSFGIDPYAVIHGWLELHGPPVQPLAEADGEIRAGGVEYLEVVVDEPGVVSIPVAAEALAQARAVRVE